MPRHSTSSPHPDANGSASFPERVVIFGGNGFFGRLLVEDLLKFTRARIAIASRRPPLPEFSPLSDRIEFIRADLNDYDSVKSSIEGALVAVCCAGPYQKLTLNLLHACIEKNIHYLDLADDRNFVRNAHAVLSQFPKGKSLPVICSGWSAVPALSGLLTRIASEGMKCIDSIHIQIAPGNLSPRNVGTVTSLLASVGSEFTICEDGAWNQVRGWSAPREFRFPSPIGPRIGYRVDVPDHELFPKIFGARSVEFHVGSELSFLNHMVSLLAWASQKGIVRDWTPFAPVLQKGMSLFGFLGHDAGAVGVEVIGTIQKARRGMRACVVAHHSGQRIPVAPAGIMVESLLRRKIDHIGLVPVESWLTWEQLTAECAKRDFQLVVEEFAA